MTDPHLLDDFIGQATKLTNAHRSQITRKASDYSAFSRHADGRVTRIVWKNPRNRRCHRNSCFDIDRILFHSATSGVVRHGG